MKLVEFWILETVVDQEDWDSSKLRIFRSYESMMDFIKYVIFEGDEIGDISIEDVKDKDGYQRSIVYDKDIPDDPYFVIHKGSIEVES